MYCLYSRLCHTHFHSTVHTHLNATPHSIVIHFLLTWRWVLLECLLTQEPCLLEVDQQTGSTFSQPYINHVLVHSSCQSCSVIRRWINSFDASPPPTSLPYRDYYTHPNNRFFFTSYQTRQSKGKEWGKNRIMIITSLFKDTRNLQKSFFSTNFFHFSCFMFQILFIYFYFIFSDWFYSFLTCLLLMLILFVFHSSYIIFNLKYFDILCYLWGIKILRK